jgi:hypothetical protein
MIFLGLLDFDGHGSWSLCKASSPLLFPTQISCICTYIYKVCGCYLLTGVTINKGADFSFFCFGGILKLASRRRNLEKLCPSWILSPRQLLAHIPKSPNLQGGVRHVALRHACTYAIPCGRYYGAYSRVPTWTHLRTCTINYLKEGLESYSKRSYILDSIVSHPWQPKCK